MTDTATSAVLLADPTRVRLLDELAAGVRRTSELAAAAGMSVAAISRHLNLLRAAGAVERLDVDSDGRGRAYRLRAGAFDGLASWIRTTSWAAELGAASDMPRTSELLARMGAFLDAFAAGDVPFFERHLRDDVTLVFPGMAEPVDKQGCVATVRTHPPYQRHHVRSEPLVRLLGGATTMITFLATVRTAAVSTERSVVVSAVFDETDPWRLVHLQWTPAAEAERPPP